MSGREEFEGVDADEVLPRGPVANGHASGGGAGLGIEIPPEVIGHFMKGGSFDDALGMLPPAMAQQMLGRLGQKLGYEVRPVGSTPQPKQPPQPLAPGPVTWSEPERAARVQPPRAPRNPPAPQQGPPRRRRREEEEPTAQGQMSLQNLLNELGKELGSHVGEYTGTAIGITFRPGGREVRVAAYFPEDEEYAEEYISRKKGHTSRLGDILGYVFADTEARFQVDSQEIADDDGDDDEEGEIEDYNPEGAEDPG